VRLGRRLLSACILALTLSAVLGAWSIIGASWALNRSWFVFTRDAFSDFGGSRSCCPGLYNYGLMGIGILVVALGYCMALAARGKLEVAGAAYAGLAGVFLGFIGYYHEGTRPHVFVSTWFFVQMDVALAMLSVGLSRRGCWLARPALYASMEAFPVAGLVGVLAGWPSAAVLETYGILIIDFTIILVALCYRRLAAEELPPDAVGPGLG
jgi:hypothetical membrane protein